MRNTASLLMTVGITAAMSPHALPAQDTRSIGLWTGLGVATPSLSQAHEREMFLVGIQYRHAIARPSFVTISYAPSVVPVVVLGRPTEPGPRCGVCVAGASIPALSSPDRSLGAGVIPAALELTFGDDAGLAIIWGGGLGFLWVDDAANRVSARPFNIMGTARFGIRADAGPFGAFDLGVRLHHLSHGGSANQPGVNVLVWSVGWSLD